ncbi:MULTISPECIES: ribonuclease III [unclassified Methylophilus]|jgi:ribonuclease III|uniref:ribonuclease III n=1 Tax=unclassified Methylophilus TaxID=2630143 RepID=UPI000700EC83|nr:MULTISPECIES: ribonuclease III [unclassified Methylophilus]KQT42122.1 ribonuclease III [Methylophilus sp. Leaf416]KQT56303.1 ribonuclease III [Methylophilus sp. Leaf459]
MSALPVLQTRIGYSFTQPELLQQALTHRSFSASNNERLEFLGDSVLNFIIAHQLFNLFPDIPEGDLSRLRAKLVKEASLAEIAIALNLGDALKLGEGELKSAGWRRPSILADALEAIVGAVYLDGGFAAAEQVVALLYRETLTTINPKVIDKDAKSQLQEYLQSKKMDLPEYQVASIEGEAHAQTFTVQCFIKKLNITTTGAGTSRRVAEQQAAKLAMEKIQS